MSGKRITTLEKAVGFVTVVLSTLAVLLGGALVVIALVFGAVCFGMRVASSSD
jgi:hypothetical protein